MKSSRKERMKLLSRVDVFGQLSAEQLELAVQRTLDRSFQTGESIYLLGDATEAVFFLLEGRVRLYTLVQERELTFDLIRAGDMFGEAALSERTQNEYAQALEPSRVGLLDLNTFWQLMKENSEFSARVIKVVGERSRMTRGRMTDIALKGVTARLASLILDLVQGEGTVTREGYYRVSANYTHEQLGSMIGVKRVAVTRAFADLQDSECVQIRRRQIYVVDLAALKGLAVEG